MELQSTGISGQASTDRAEHGPDIGFPHGIGSGLSHPLIDRSDEQTNSTAFVGLDKERTIIETEVRARFRFRQLLATLGHSALSSK